MKMLPALAVLPALLCALSVSAASPAGPAASGAAMDACRADVQKLCPGVAPGEGRIAACLKDKRKDLSKDCKAALAKARRGAGKPAD